MRSDRSAFGMAMIANDIGDAMDRLTELALDQRAWREPRKQSLRERGEAKNLPASDK
jgi:hypothetical protein